MSSPPVSVVLSGGRPVVNVADLSKLVPNMTPVPDGKGPPVTIVQSGAPPVNFVTPGGYLDVNAQLTGLAGVEPILAADLKSGQAWLRGAPYALTSLPGWSFSRASAAYGETSGGVLVPFASGAPRLVNGRGQLIEGARTNLCLRSQEFDNASWTKTSCAVTADAIAAPDGTTTADLITRNGTGDASITQSVTVSALTTYTYSVYVAAGSVGFAVIQIAFAGASGAYYYLNLSTGAVSQAVATYGASPPTSLSTSVRSAANGFWRAILTFTMPAAITAVVTYVKPITAGTGSGSESTNNGQSCYAWGAQIEAAAFPSSYIPTTTTSVTRPADIPLIDISAYSPAITYPLTMYARFERVVDTGGAEVLLLIGASDSERGCLIVSSADTADMIVTTGGAQQNSSTSVAGALALATPYRSAMRAADNDMRCARGGVLGNLDATGTMPASPGRITLGTAYSGGSPMFGYLSELAIIPGAVSDANLPRLAPA